MPDSKTLPRCPWVKLENQMYVEYHDHEWGVPVFDDRTLFEFLILEGAQAGLSWETVLKKRENYRLAFDNFDVHKIAKYTSKNEKRLLENPGIIRNRLKISSTITNAQHFLQIQNEFGSFSRYIWNFVKNTPVQNSWKTLADFPARTSLSDVISKDLKKRGFRFVGTTIIYAYLQAIGIVNDHTVDCFCRTQSSLKDIKSSKKKKIFSLEILWQEKRKARQAVSRKNLDQYLSRIEIEEECHSLLPKTPSFINLIFVSPEEIRRLNKEYRKKNSMTDVLSFNIVSREEETISPESLFGEIYICTEKAQLQAEELGHSFLTEVQILFVHGVLHLLGFDHELDTDFRQMNAIEKKILK